MGSFYWAEVKHKTQRRGMIYHFPTTIWSIVMAIRIIVIVGRLEILRVPHSLLILSWPKAVKTSSVTSYRFAERSGHSILREVNNDKKG